MTALLKSCVRGPRPFTHVIPTRIHCSAIRNEASSLRILYTSIQNHSIWIQRYLQAIEPSREAAHSSSSELTATPRRQLLLTVASTALAAIATPAWAAENNAVTSSLGRYVKRKKLDNIDSYVAPLLEAKEQLVRVGRVMRKYYFSYTAIYNYGTDWYEPY